MHLFRKKKCDPCLVYTPSVPILDGSALSVNGTLNTTSKPGTGSFHDLLGEVGKANLDLTDQFSLTPTWGAVTFPFKCIQH